VRALTAIRESKTVVDWGNWQSGHKMPRTAFPLSKSHSYVLGASWRWRVLDLDASGRRLRLLVAYERAKSQYRAWLGLEAGADQALLARLEYHPSHHGWHCHFKVGNLADVACGVVKDSRERERLRHCAVGEAASVGVTDNDALSIAFRAFNVEDDLGGLFG
jgi:hypothetical protein